MIDPSLMNIDDKRIAESITAKANPYLNQISFQTPNDPHIGVPEHSHVPLIYYIMLLLGSTFLTLGITALASVSGYITTEITSFFYTLTGWNPIITGLILGCICLLLATIFYVNGARAKQVAQKIHDVINTMEGDTKPRNFYDMDAVPIKYKIQALERIGCKIYQDRDLRGITIHCDTIDESQVFTNVNYDLNISRKYVQFIVICLIPLILTFSAYEGWWLYTDWEAIIWFGVMVFCLLILIELYTVPLWVTVILGWGYLLLALISLIGSMSLGIWWNFSGIWLAYSCVIASLYYLKSDFCKPNSVICTRM